MKIQIRHSARRAVCGSVALTAFVLALPASAQTAAYWDPSATGNTSAFNSASASGGTGNWDSTDSFWYVNDTTFGPVDETWSSTDIANFGGTAGTVTLTSAIEAAGLVFTTTGYTIATGSYTLQIDGSGINASALSSGNTTITGNVALGAAQTWTVGSGSTLAVSAAVSGAYALTEAGSGTLTLSGNNTYSGATTIGSGGTLTLGGTGLLGGGSYAGAIANAGTFNYASSGTQTLSGIISGTGALNVSAGNLTLSGTNTYTGNTTLSGGTVNANNGSAFGTGTIYLNGGTLDNNAAVTIANNIVVSSGGGTITIGNNNLTLTGNLSGSGTLTVGNSATVQSIYFNVTNNMTGGSITTGGAGNVIRFNTASAGNANVAWSFNSGSTGSRGTNLDFGSGTIYFGSLAGNGIVSGDTSTGNITISVGALNTTTTFSGQIKNGSGNVTLLLTGGTLNLASGGGSGTVQTALTINSGATANTTVQDALGYNSGASTTTVTVNAGGTFNDGAAANEGYITNFVLNGGTVSYTGTPANTTVGINFSTGYGITAGNSTTSTWSAPIILRSTTALPVTVNSGSNLIISGAINQNAGSGNVSSLLLSGGGNLTLSGVNTYTGSTTVSAGKLALTGTGSLASTSYVIAAGATFDVSGLTTPGYALAAATTLGVSGSTNGFINVGSGALTLSKALTLNFTSSISTGTFDLYSANSVSGDFSSVTLTGLLSGSLASSGTSGGNLVWSATLSGYNLSLAESTGVLTVASAIPEPATCSAFLGLGALGLAFWRRRSCRRG